ncbi:hypothetical protein BC834DRAFT_1016098 [Gloeopeniophorella convolvens]|nr:hypothetical protein BC834DRAFT_1016098 [Gloeopeniophorella convolvens]
MAGPVPVLGASSGFQLYRNYILNLCPLVILYYDFAVTFSREVELFWPPKHKLGFVSIVFLLNRYVAFFGNLIVAEAYFTNPAPEACVGVSLGTIGWTVSRGEGPDVIQVISAFPGCNQWIGVDAGRRFSITWACVAVFDSVIFALTVYKALISGRRVRLLNVLVRDSAMYFTYDNPTIPTSGTLTACDLQQFSYFMAPVTCRHTGDSERRT